MMLPWKSALTSLACIVATLGMAAFCSVTTPAGCGPKPSSSEMYPSHKRWSGTYISNLSSSFQILSTNDRPTVSLTLFHPLATSTIPVAVGGPLPLASLFSFSREPAPLTDSGVKDAVLGREKLLPSSSTHLPPVLKKPGRMALCHSPQLLWDAESEERFGLQKSMARQTVLPRCHRC